MPTETDRRSSVSIENYDGTALIIASEPIGLIVLFAEHGDHSTITIAGHVSHLTNAHGEEKSALRQRKRQAGNFRPVLLSKSAFFLDRSRGFALGGQLCSRFLPHRGVITA
jgi:hypothetical protein